MASELGLNPKKARRAGLLHDIGKVPDDEPELPHAQLGMKLAEKYKEKADICNAIGAHHDEEEATSLYAPIVQVCDAISGARPGARREVVEAYIKSFCKKHKLYAVRSSGIDEDSDNYSFAGVHDTFLNVKYNDIKENIKKVINSATSELAINYRKNNHLQTSNIRIAVVIQEMVDADYAGVINTINPVTNNTFETVIPVTVVALTQVLFINACQVGFDQ